jgi:mono/diheme cytochrome c family protein
MGLIKYFLGLFIAIMFLPVTSQAVETTPQVKKIVMKTDLAKVQRGRYLVKITGCNDCHTQGYIETDGKVPEKDWLTGSTLGWRGPWGTTYGRNLRSYFSRITENEWVKIAHTFQPRPPMPWPAVHAMEERDLRALYQYIKSLGPGGEEAPAYVPPDQEPKQPYVLFPAPPK